MRQNLLKQAGYMAFNQKLVKAVSKEHHYDNADKKVSEFIVKIQNQEVEKNRPMQINFAEPEKNVTFYSKFDSENQDNPHSKNILEMKKNEKKQKKRLKATTDSGPIKINLASAIIRPSNPRHCPRNKNIKLTHITHNLQEEEFHCKNESEVKQNMGEWATEILKQSIVDTIFHYASEGDLQSSALMLLVFKNKINIPMQRVSSVLRSYVNLLNRMECKFLAAEVVKFSNSTDLQNEYGKNSGVSTKCQYCKNKESGKEVKCYLDKCKKFNTH